jgi:hypothetical protein
MLPAAAIAAERPPLKTPACRVTVDPRVELMCVIFRLAGNREYNMATVKKYADDVDKQFGPFRDHPVVKLARKLRNIRGVGFDAPMSMAVHLPGLDELKDETPFTARPPTLDGRWTADDATKFATAARQFVKDASFREFLDKHRLLYELTESRLQRLLEKKVHVEWFRDFFGERPKAAFVVVPGLLNGGCNYGPSRRTAGGKEELFCVLGVWHVDAKGMPTFGDGQVGTIVHEFCHSYANAVVDRHANELKAAGQKMFPLVAKKMQSMAYDNWQTMFYESLVRACVLRYVRHYDGGLAAWTATKEEQWNGFSWMDGLTSLLEEYETHRDRYPSLESFSPRLITFFSEQAKTLPQQQTAIKAKRPKIVSITPANDATDVDPNLDTIKVVFDRPMKKGSWAMCGGGPHFPAVVDTPGYDAQRTTWTVHVKLKPDWGYEFMLNAGRFDAFQSADGTPLEDTRVKFKTGEPR